MKSPHFPKNAERLKQVFNKLTPDEARLISEFFCEDPLAGIYALAMVIYAGCMVLILFWPFDFDFAGQTNHVKWSQPAPGVEFTGAGQIISPSSSRSLYDRLTKGEGFTIEVWVRPANNWQGGPARIVSYSIDPNLRNFTLAQKATDLQVRLRTTHTNLNATVPVLNVQHVFLQPKPVHIVVSYDFKEQKVFVDGNLKVRAAIPGDQFNNWDPAYWLILGNEATGDRPWLGKIAYLAIYNQSFEAGEVRDHFMNVKNWVSGDAQFMRLGKAPVVQYLLDEKKGTRVTDSGTMVTPLVLEIPEKIQNAKKPFLAPIHHRLVKVNSYAGYEMLLNVLIFIPFAFLLHALLARRINGFWGTMIAVIVLGGATTFSVEMLQYFSQTRNSSLTDVGTNLLGVLLGVLFKVIYDSLIGRNQKKRFGLLS